MLQPVFTTSFEKDVKRIEKRGYDMAKLKAMVDILVLNQRPLPPAYKDHPLKGKWEPKRELHIEPDWLLVYEISGEQCFFARTGTHSDLFGK
jgi:mRNA interferase YafQ